MPDLRIEFSPQKGNMAIYSLRIAPELFFLQVNDSPLDFMTAIICQQNQNLIQNLREFSRTGFITPLGLAYPGALRLIGIEGYMRPPCDRIIVIDFKDNHLRIDDESHHLWDIKTCASRLNISNSPSGTHPLHEHYINKEDLRLKKEAAGFAIGISDSLKNSLYRFTPSLLTGLATFAAVNQHFTNDGRELKNYVSVWMSRVSEMADIFKRHGAIIGNRGLFPSSYQQGPTMGYFREMCQERNIHLGQVLGKIALNFTEHDIMRACLALGDKTKLPIKDNYEFKNYQHETLTAHQQMTAMTAMQQLQSAFSDREAA